MNIAGIVIILLTVGAASAETPIYLAVTKTTSWLFVKHLNFNIQTTKEADLKNSDSPLASLWYITAGYYEKLGKELKILAEISLQGENKEFDCEIEKIDDSFILASPREHTIEFECQDDESLMASITNVIRTKDSFVLKILYECLNDDSNTSEDREGRETKAVKPFTKENSMAYDNGL